MGIDREQGVRWAQSYGRTWSHWDVEGFVRLFTEEVVYVEHPTGRTVIGREDLDGYVREEQRSQGPVTVRIGDPVVEGDRVAGEFWATGEDGAVVGGFIAHLDGGGQCSVFREYWFELDSPVEPFPGWGS
jgi:SnoaL-like domain